MLRKYRNALFESVQQANLDPSVLKVSGKTDAYSSVSIAVDDSDLKFIVFTKRFNGEERFKYENTVYRPELEQSIGYYRSGPATLGPPDPYDGWLLFEKVKDAFSKWLEAHVKTYLFDQAEQAKDEEYPDLWAETSIPLDTAANFQALQNTRFSSDEQARIADAFGEFEIEVGRLNLLSEDEVRELHDQVEYLVGASKRLGRKDWLLAAAGALFSFTVQSGLSAVTAGQVLQLASKGLQWIILHGPLLNP